MKKTVERMMNRWLRETGRRMRGDDSQRREVLDGLEEHIREALHERTAGRPATEEDLVAVLESIDPPDAFAGEFDRDPRKAEADQLARTAAWTLAGTVGAIVAILLISLTGWITGGVAVVVGFVGFLASGVMGLVSWRSMLGRAVGIASVILLLGLLALVPMRVETGSSSSEGVQTETTE